MSHYISIKYHRKYYLYARSEDMSHKSALNRATFKAADTFKHVYNSSIDVRKIKSDINANAYIKIYQTYDEYFAETKDIPLGDKYYI